MQQIKSDFAREFIERQGPQIGLTIEHNCPFIPIKNQKFLTINIGGGNGKISQSWPSPPFIRHPVLRSVLVRRSESEDGSEGGCAGFSKCHYSELVN